ncbi:hypothetical protein [Streptomyces botrytidirepellens]|uniref:hypothetical protein n=1 Tax=Streptomyces botrytidirepellens TaxID=2486417 RepID=UPI0026D03AA5
MDDDEERSFRAFVAARSPALMRSATLLSGGDTHAAEDLLQTALAKTAGRWKRLESPELRILVRRALTRRTTRQRAVLVLRWTPPRRAAWASATVITRR